MAILGRRRRLAGRREYPYRRRYYRPYYRRGDRWGARRVAGSDTIDALARFGFITRGITYVVIGVIAVMLALGIAEHEPDRAGALEAIASKPLGYLLLWVLTIGFGGLALWRLTQAAVMRLNPSGRHRLKALGGGIAYAIAFVTTLMFVMHGRVPASSDTTSHDLTATVMARDGGRAVVAIVGLIIIAAGMYMVLRGMRVKFTRQLRMGWMRRSTRETVVWLGETGYVARGLVVIGIGIAAVDAAITYDSARAKGVDGVLRSFATSPFGPWLLILVAIGLIAFGLLSFLEARWRRSYGGVPI